MEKQYKKDVKRTIALSIFTILFVAASGYGVYLLFCSLVLRVLCKLGVIATWTWDDAALWAIIVYGVCCLLRGIFSSKKGEKGTS